METERNHSLFPLSRKITLASAGISRRAGWSPHHTQQAGEEHTMSSHFDRRELLAIAGLGGLGIVFGSSIVPPAAAQGYGPATPRPAEDFFFIHLADTHWGFNDDSVNPDAAGTFKKAIAAINALSRQPDFIAFTGDMTHTTDSAAERRQRMSQMRDMTAMLKTKDIRYVPGDHDAQKDRGEAYQEFFGKLNYTFDHKGYHFIVLDNTSDPDQKLGEAQIAWLAADLKQLTPGTPVVVFTHRPLFELYQPWGWWTPDGGKALDLLKPFKATVFYGHVHHENHTTAGGLVHHATESLMIPLYPAGTRPDRTMVPWNAATPYRGMGWLAVSALGKGAGWDINEVPVAS
jgi:predicted phosphodiesterase